jgi:hypothetical protein
MSDTQGGAKLAKAVRSPCMSIERAINTALTERNLETTFKVKMFSVWAGVHAPIKSVSVPATISVLQPAKHVWKCVSNLPENVATLAASERAQD